LENVKIGGFGADFDHSSSWSSSWDDERGLKERSEDSIKKKREQEFIIRKIPK